MSQFLARMIDRVYASMAQGPSLNCRPHHSRQRIDLARLAQVGDGPATPLADLLGDAAEHARLGRPRGAAEPLSDEAVFGDERPPESESAAARALREQEAVLTRLTLIAEDARVYVQDTGAHVLYVGFPLLSLPTASGRGKGRRILAPVAFVPVNLAVRGGRRPSIHLQCAAEAGDRVTANHTLLAWLEAQTGAKLGDLVTDEEGRSPWHEIGDLVRRIGDALDIAPPPPLGPATTLAAVPETDALREPAFVLAGVLGLFPQSNQSILDDLKAMAVGETPLGIAEPFLRMDASLLDATVRGPDEATIDGARVPSRDALLTSADPCQARAVALARHAGGLVVHGPPGTGKSQTITNIVGDHLARGQRVLIVCDKRTALDVVFHRLDHLGLGHLCALVHDPERDRADFYRAVREQLDALVDAPLVDDPGAARAAVDAELDGRHDELRRVMEALHGRADERREDALHALVGEWLAREGDAEGPSHGLLPAALAPHQPAVHEVVERCRRIRFTSHPWREAAGGTLEAWMRRPLDEWRRRMRDAADAAVALDAVPAPAMPLPAEGDVRAAAAARAALAGQLRPLVRAHPTLAARLASSSETALRQRRESIGAHGASLAQLRETTRDPELEQGTHGLSVTPAQLGGWTVQLEDYLDVSGRWWRFLAFWRLMAVTRAAREVLLPFGLRVGRAAAERALGFVRRRRARLLLDALHRELREDVPPPDDAGLLDEIEAARALVDVLLDLPAECAVTVRRELGAVERQSALLEDLEASVPRAAAVATLEEAMRATALLAPAWTAALAHAARRGEPVAAKLSPLAEKVDDVEHVLRVRARLAELPPPLRTAVEAHVDGTCGPEAAWRSLERAAYAAAIAQRIQAHRHLDAFDAERLQATLARYGTLERQKHALVRQQVLHHWQRVQRDSLLASTGSRLNGAGAALRRRLVTRGQNALRLRQCLALGAEAPEGDPLFDLRPVWMASPQTVAQVLPRRAVFDVVVFDEASQCRLEEALPVLLRAKRLVIAGDEKQLPPTRFFESALAESRLEEAEDESALFEQRQAEIEDLLGAALNLELEKSYLDVHYRSNNADLIEFSNHSFYGSRLQAIPGHPRNVAPHAPITLLHVDGVYDKRVNLQEAQAVVALVRDLLAREAPPSIGIACFSLAQRTALLSALSKAAAEDPTFAARLEIARNRRGAGSFEGLFVKNLENVQGDERDHMIIATTYGPAPNGRFFRRFGPLATAGGGRRLNVLVTRARRHIHLVTSIPPEIYRSPPPLEPGQTPSGAWLLLEYLRFAEALEAAYRAEDEGVTPVPEGVVERPSRTPSPPSAVLARQLLAERGVGSVVHWGNEGFCVDIAARHPRTPEGVTVGALVDFARFDRAGDRVEWDLFRSALLQATGWELVRLWSHQVFRDPAAARRRLAEAHERYLEAESRALAAVARELDGPRGPEEPVRH